MKTKSEILSIDVKLPVEEGHQNHVCRQGQPALEPAPRRPGLLRRREAPPRVPARRQRPIAEALFPVAGGASAALFPWLASPWLAAEIRHGQDPLPQVRQQRVVD